MIIQLQRLRENRVLWFEGLSQEEISALFREVEQLCQRKDDVSRFALLGILDTLERAAQRRKELRDLEDQWKL